MRHRTGFAIRTTVVVLAGMVGCGEAQPTVPVMFMWDVTGPTASYPSALLNAGVKDYLDHVNATGGIAGHHITYQVLDHTYDGARASLLYAEAKKDDDRDADGRWDTLVTIFGEASPDTVALRDSVTRDEVPYFSHVYPGSLTAPQPLERSVTLPDGDQFHVTRGGTPYNFFVGTDYSTGIRLALQFIKESGGQKVALVGCSNDYCTAPLAAGRSFAATLGLETIAGPQPCVPGETSNACPEMSDGVLDVNEKMGRYVQQHPDVDWMWLGHLSTTAYRVVKAVHQVAPQVKFVTSVFGADELTAEWCGAPCVGRLHAVMPFAVFGDRSAAGMVQLEQVMAANDRTDPTWRNVRYVQGYTAGMVWSRAVERVVGRGEAITGPNIKAALESFVELSTDGLTAPISYAPDDHRPNSRARIYAIDTSGRLSLQREVEVELEPWWLGW